jgi:exosortase
MTHTDFIVPSLVLLCVLFVLYLSILENLFIQWWTDPDYGHAFFVPLFSAYVLWRQRERWMKIDMEPSNFGLLVILAAVGLLLVGSLGAELFTSRFSLLVLLAGIIIFSLAFLIFMIPLPAIIYNQITFPLQMIASRFAAFWLELVQVPVLRDGNVLILSNYSLEVVEACSGIRSLISLVSLAVIYGYFVEPRRWVRYLLVVLMVPIAIFSNAIRITGAGIMAHRYGAAGAEGFLHEFSGWLIFVIALVLLLMSHFVLRHVGKGPTRPVHG